MPPGCPRLPQGSTQDRRRGQSHVIRRVAHTKAQKAAYDTKNEACHPPPASLALASAGPLVGAAWAAGLQLWLGRAPHGRALAGLARPGKR